MIEPGKKSAIFTVFRRFILADGQLVQFPVKSFQSAELAQEFVRERTAVYSQLLSGSVALRSEHTPLGEVSFGPQVQAFLGDMGIVQVGHFIAEIEVFDVSGIVVPQGGIIVPSSGRH